MMGATSKKFDLYSEGVHELDAERIESGLGLLRESEHPDGLLIRLVENHLTQFVPSIADYGVGEKLRTKFLCINLLLNERQLVAPSFRLLPKSTRQLNTRGEKAYARDKQLIDLHWAYWHQKAIGQVRSVIFDDKVLWDETGFKMETALTVVSARLTSPVKCQRLGFSTDLQTSLSVLRSDAVAQKWRRIEEKKLQLRCDLEDQANSPTGRLSHDVIDKRVDEYTCLSLAGWSPSKAVVFWRWMLGGCVDPSSRESQITLFKRRSAWFKKRGLKS